jgi:hypothetical protein
MGHNEAKHGLLIDLLMLILLAHTAALNRWPRGQSRKNEENKYEKITTQWCSFCLHPIVHPPSSIQYPASGTLRLLRVATLRDKNLKSPNRHPILLGRDSICSKSYYLMASNITASAIRVTHTTVFNEICCDMIVI